MTADAQGTSGPSLFRSRQTIQSWVDEFVALGYPLVGEVRVLEQDATAGESTGLVLVESAIVLLRVTITPTKTGSPWWVAVVQPEFETVVVTASETAMLASGLTALSALCAFLEAKSTAYLELIRP